MFTVYGASRVNMGQHCGMCVQLGKGSLRINLPCRQRPVGPVGRPALPAALGEMKPAPCMSCPLLQLGIDTLPPGRKWYCSSLAPWLPGSRYAFASTGRGEALAFTVNKHQCRTVYLVSCRVASAPSCRPHRQGQREASKALALSSGWIVRFPCFASVSAPCVPAPHIGGFLLPCVPGSRQKRRQRPCEHCPCYCTQACASWAAPWLELVPLGTACLATCLPCDYCVRKVNERCGVLVGYRARTDLCKERCFKLPDRLGR